MTNKSVVEKQHIQLVIISAHSSITVSQELGHQVGMKYSSEASNHLKQPGYFFPSCDMFWMCLP